MRLLVCCVLFLVVAPLSAEPIYRFTDAEGKVHYSTKPPSKDAKPADLPKIMRGDFKVPQIKKKNEEGVSGPLSCHAHGGISCAKGADSDGSVICTDDFKESGERFALSCLQAKLSIAGIREAPFSVTIRNESQSTAKEVQILAADRQLVGPAEIPPSEAADYQFPTDPNFKVPQAAITATCLNCQ